MRIFKVMHLAAACVLLASAALAQPNAEQSAQQTISSQLDAFSKDEWTRAYSYAAPNIKLMYPSETAFRQMVVTGYPPVHRPQSFTFGETRIEDGSVTQNVFILGPDGKEYEAVYSLELQEDGVYRIKGVSLRGSRSLGV